MPPFRPISSSSSQLRVVGPSSSNAKPCSSSSSSSLSPSRATARPGSQHARNRLLHVRPFRLSGNGSVADVVDEDGAVGGAEGGATAFVLVPGELIEGAELGGGVWRRGGLDGEGWDLERRGG
jgi:hypothetical protein